jgi:dTDP-4-dehydrorhamnose reductase
MNVLITGGRGQLAQAMQFIAAAHPKRFYFLDKEGLDVTRSASWHDAIDRVKPDLIINAAAYTAVELAQLHHEEARMLNAEAPALGAAISAAKGIGFVQLSTDYVFDGRSATPYTEDDRPAPLNVYGGSKLEGEEKVKAVHPGAWIIRLSWLYSQFGKNFMNTMLHRFASNEPVRVVNDQVASPTCAVRFGDDLLEFIGIGMAQATPGGLYHYSLEGTASWFDLAVAIRDRVGSRSEVLPVSSDQYTSAVKRPAYSKLDNTKFTAVLGRALPSWQVGLDICMNRL